MCAVFNETYTPRARARSLRTAKGAKTQIIDFRAVQYRFRARLHTGINKVFARGYRRMSSGSGAVVIVFFVTAGFIYPT